MTEIHFDEIDFKNRVCPVCGKPGQRFSDGQYKHTKRIRVSPTKTQVKTTYCGSLKREA